MFREKKNEKKNFGKKTKDVYYRINVKSEEHKEKQNEPNRTNGRKRE